MAFNFKQFKSVYANSVNGKNSLLQAIEYAKQEEFVKAIPLAEKANKNFVQAASDYSRLAAYFNLLPYFSRDSADLATLINSASELSQAVNKGVVLGAKIENLLPENKKISYSKLSPEEKRLIINALSEAGPELQAIKINLDQALNNLNQVKLQGALAIYASDFSKIRTKVTFADELLADAITLTEVLPALAGTPQKSSYLVLFQNQDELRPTGGFLGVYGILEIENGEFVRLDTHDIYHLDMPVKDFINIDPPEEIRKYLVPKWYLRDANWSPDWPTSAKKIQEFYHLEDGLLPEKNQINNFSGAFSGVIGITPGIVTSLLTIIGPVTIEGQEYNASNFTDLLEYRVERQYNDLDIPKWERKEVIGDICEEIKKRIFDIPSTQWPRIIQLVNENIEQKNILIYHNDPKIQTVMKEIGLAGEIKETGGDYFFVVDANLRSLKTDAVMNRSLAYTLKKEGKKTVARLNANYSHSGSADWKTTAYNSFTRVYVPAGSHLNKVEGCAADSGKIGSEQGKTFFGCYFTIQPGQIHQLVFEYELPSIISDLIDSGRYDLYAQRQPGSRIQDLKINLNFDREISGFAPAGYFATKNNQQSISWENSFAADRNFQITF